MKSHITVDEAAKNGESPKEEFSFYAQRVEWMEQKNMLQYGQFLMLQKSLKIDD